MAIVESFNGSQNKKLHGPSYQILVTLLPKTVLFYLLFLCVMVQMHTGNCLLSMDIRDVILSEYLWLKHYFVSTLLFSLQSFPYFVLCTLVPLQIVLTCAA